MKKYVLVGVCKYHTKNSCCDNWNFSHPIEAKNNKNAVKAAKSFLGKFKKKHIRSTKVLLNVSLRPVEPLLEIQYKHRW